MSKKIIVLNSSAISYYLQCPEKWNLAFNQHLVLADGKREAMDKGNAFHKLLELYYIERLTLDVYQAAKVAKDKYQDSEEYKLVPEHQQFLLQRFNDYIIRYATNDFQPIKLDTIPSTEVGFSYLFYETEDYQFILEGKIDLISSIQQEMIIVDHKTQGRYAELYQFRPQFKTYSLISGIRKMVINYIGLQKNVNDLTLRRTLITFPEHIIEEWKKKIFIIFANIQATLETEIPFEKNDDSCGGPFGIYPCQFTTLCEVNKENKELIQNLKNFKYIVRPYESWSLPSEEI